MPDKQRFRPSGLCLSAIVCASLLAACGNPLRQEAALQTNLSPTRTPAPQSETPATRAPAPTTAPSPTAETKAAATKPASKSAATPTDAPTAEPIATRFDLCSATKPGLTAQPPAAITSPGQIVFLTTDNNIVLTDSAGRDRLNVTSDAFVSPSGDAGRIYMFPTFSNDGKMLAFVSASTTTDFNGITNTVHVAPAVDGAKRVDLYATNQFNIPYLDFSPDGQQVAFLTISGSDAAIRVVSKTGGDVTVFGSGAPTYWNWRSDSAAILTHLGGRAESKGDATISLISAKGATKTDQTDFDALPGNFQSPQLAPDGQHMLYVANTGNDRQDELVLADAGGKPLCAVTGVRSGAFFAWSPDGAHVAVLDSATPIQKPADVQVFDLADGSSKTAHEDTSMFWWSPDGSKLATYSIVFDAKLNQISLGSSKLGAPAAQQAKIGLRLEVIDVASGAATRVADIFPSTQLQQYFQFFDQYSRSLSPWSPDGTQLVFTTALPSAQTADVAVAKLSPSGVELKRVAAGTIAFWSPR